MAKFELEVEPSELTFAEGKEQLELKLKNTTEKKVAFKVKCTDNDLFKVGLSCLSRSFYGPTVTVMSQIRPAIGLLEKGESVGVSLAAKIGASPPTKKHHFAVFHVEAPSDKKEAKEVWNDAKTDAVASKRFPATFEPAKPPADGGAEKKKEETPPPEKEEEKAGGEEEKKEE